MAKLILTNTQMAPAASDERRAYLIEGFQVSFLHQAEWRCACREFSSGGACRHTREALGMREAQALIRRRLGERGLSVRRLGAQSNRRSSAIPEPLGFPTQVPATGRSLPSRQRSTRMTAPPCEADRER
jgi:hypothetical protein